MAFNVISKTILKSLFSKPATAMYPIVKNEFYPNTRGSIQVDMNSCTLCTLCSKRCPADALTVSKAERKWEIDRTRCVICNFCVHVCPKNSLTTIRQYSSPMTDKSQRFSAHYGEAVAPAGAKEE